MTRYFPIDRRRVLQILVVATAYAIGTGASLLTPQPYPYLTLIFPAVGIGIAAGLLYGVSGIVAVLIGGTLGCIVAGVSAELSVAFAIGDAASIALAAALVRLTTQRFDRSLGSVRDALLFTGVALLSMSLSAVVGIAALVFFHIIPTTAALRALLMWWTGRAFGALVFAPFFLVWFGARGRALTSVRFIEKGFFGIGIIAINWLFFWSDIGQWHSVLPFLYITALPLLYAAVRFGPHGKMSALVLTAISGVIGTLAGYGPFTGESTLGSVLGVDIFFVLISTVFLVFSSVTEENYRWTTELSTHNVDLERALRKIRSVDQAKTDFLATLAHELRNPLAPIVSALDSLELVSTNATASAVTSIRTHITTITKLLDDLLDISRISRRKFALSKEHTNLCDAITRAVAVARPILQDRRHALSLALPEDEIWIHGDPLRIEQIVINLLNNAARYTEPGGLIQLSCMRDGGYAVIQVEDNGIGIPEDMLERIFEPFQQADAASSGSAGLGLGLSLVRTLTELHGGLVSAASKGRGQGSQFTLRLPALSKAQLQLFTPDTILADTPRPPARSILIVDDNEAAAKGLSMLLRRAGHTVRIAHDGLTALSVASDSRPDVMILDIGLPDMDGYELARRMRESGSAATLIALSGYGTDEDKAKATEAGFRFHITKPVGIADLEKTLARIG